MYLCDELYGFMCEHLGYDARKQTIDMNVRHIMLTSLATNEQRDGRQSVLSTGSEDVLLGPCL